MEAEGAKCVFERSIDKNLNYDMQNSQEIEIQKVVPIIKLLR